MIDLKRTNSTDPDFTDLVGLLDADLAIRDGAEHGFYHQFNSIQNLQHVVVGYVDGKPAACGAFKPYSDLEVEIKRMYVLPEKRGRGLAAAVLNELERWAADLSYNACVLETGKKQPEAIALYTKAGYERIPNYGQYQNVENSVCMKKQLQQV